MPYHDIADEPANPTALELAQTWRKKDYDYGPHINPHETIKGRDRHGVMKTIPRYGQTITPGQLIDNATGRFVNPYEPPRTSWGGDDVRWGGARLVEHARASS